jgi:hypothetical protein
MATNSVFEIVQLPNGDYALQSVGEQNEQLVKISFGKEAKAFLGEKDVLIAKAMIGAAVKAVEGLRKDDLRKKQESDKPRILH